MPRTYSRRPDALRRVVSVPMSEDLYAWVRRHAAEKRSTVAEVVRGAVTAEKNARERQFRREQDDTDERAAG